MSEFSMDDIEPIGFLKIDIGAQPPTVRFLTEPDFMPGEYIDRVFGDDATGRMHCPFDGTWGSCALCDHFEFMALLEIITGVPIDRWGR